MVLPAEFSETEHLQGLVRRYVNRMVRDDFIDLGGDDWEPTVGTTRASMRHACTHRDNDPITSTLLRLFIYYFIYRKARDLQASIYGVPKHVHDQEMRFHPQIKLYFSEDADDVETSFDPIEAEYSFRLIGETPSSITKPDALVFANKIKTLFAINNGFRFKKGRELWTYADLPKGYNFKIYAWSEAEAKRVIEQMLDIQGHTPDWNAYLKDKTQRRNLSGIPPIPPNKTVYGKSRRMPRRLPIGWVRFRYAELSVWGMQEDICLCDRTGFRKNPLVEL